VETALSSRTSSVTIGPGHPFCVIGERINPTGRKRLAELLAAGDFSLALQDAASQIEAGAHALDLNAGVPLVDEAALLRELTLRVQETVDVPLCLDSSVVEALEAALGVCAGKPLVNSVTAETDRLERILPLVARHGAAVIGLVTDEDGIPVTAAGRVANARRIVGAAGDYGIPPEDVVVDPLAIAVATDPGAPRVTLETIRLVGDELGVNTCLGASNVSFGLPERVALTSAFLTMAIAAGLTAAIMNPLVGDEVKAVRASELLTGNDEYAARWIAASRAGAARLGARA
jgi:5-methyltetrahydrofolate--homocysteine methyltransferase